MKSFVVGIDPGRQGAVAILSYLQNAKGVFLDVGYYRLPYKDQHLKVDLLYLLFKRYLIQNLSYAQPFICIEDLGTFGRTTPKNYISMGKSFGRMTAVLEMLGLRYSLVEAREWQKDVLTKGGKNTDKIKTWEAVETYFGPRSLFKNDGIADASLIALSYLFQVHPLLKKALIENRHVFKTFQPLKVK